MTDIRVGDLVKATSKRYPEESVTIRVTEVKAGAVRSRTWLARFEHHDIEVLDRPAPPIDEELLKGAVGAYLDSIGFPNAHVGEQIRGGVTAVINYVNEYHNKKESHA